MILFKNNSTSFFLNYNYYISSLIITTIIISNTIVYLIKNYIYN